MDMSDVLKYLPEDCWKACWDTKAMQRKKGIQNEKQLLTLCMYYAYDKSLIDTRIYAMSFHSIAITDVGFMKRFANCNDWFKWINRHLIEERTAIYNIPEKLKSKRVIAIDASKIVSKGAVKQTWCLHYAFELFSMSTAEFHITSQEVGETLDNFTLRADDLVIADRAYATITGIERCSNSEADFIMRVRNKAFKLYDESGNDIKLTEDLLQNITDNECLDKIIYYKPDRKNLKPVRLCAVKKSDEEIAYEQAELRKKQSKKQTVISDDTKLSHNYFFVLTSLNEEFTADEIFKLYRLRWQAEMLFKRYKSILNLGSLPTKTAKSSEAWLNCKMMIALLIEKMLSSVDFSPCGECKKQLERNEDIVQFDFSMFFQHK
jgi:hypothetical protein